ncbi:MAG: porin [Kofleriaceae bacterium]
MSRTAGSFTFLCLLSSVAFAQPAPDGPANAPDAPPTENPPPTDQPLIESESTLPTPPPAPTEETKAKPNAGFDKGFFLRSDDDKYALKITGRFQPFFNYSYVTATKDSKPQFEMRRMRLVLDGHIHGKNLLYKFQADFGKGHPTVKDAHIDVKLANETWLRFGQWKRPFSRQQINSSGRLEMTDRSITDRAFGAGRDVGIAIRNDYEKSPEVEWTLGVFNGRGEAPALTGTVTVDPMTGMGTLGSTSTTNVPSEFRPAVVGRVGYNSKGMKGYSEADLEGGPLRFGAGASVWLEGDFDDDAVSSQKVQADYILKAEGFSTTGGVYFMTAQDGDSILDQASSLFGFHAQAGYMLAPKWQAVARYGYINDVTLKSTTARDQQEIAVAGNFFGVGHDAKFQGGMRLIKNGDGKFTDVWLIELGANVGW